MTGDWIYEIKFEAKTAARAVSAARGTAASSTPPGQRLDTAGSRLHKRSSAAKAATGLYDGEIVMLDESGRPSFSGLQNAIEGVSNDAIVFYLFDVPTRRARPARVPVEERRRCGRRR